MKSLFAPWRMEFVEGHREDQECVLCTLSRSEVSKAGLVLYSGQSMYVVLNKFPYSNGHLMVVPRRRLGDWTALNPDELMEMGTLTQRCIQTLTRAFSPQGFNLGVNLGRASGAGIADHVHQHIVPRWVGDFNFMPLFSETKVISEHLERTYERLVEAWR